jgi:hypothetical protein
LILYLKGAKRRGHGAFLKDKLIVEGQTYDLKYLLKNIQLETGGGVNVPADNRLERMEEISQQRRKCCNFCC